MFQSRRIAKSESFTSAKTRGPIPAGHPLVREALIQASLDSAVRSIEFLASSATVFGTTVALNTVVVTRDDGRFALDIAEARPLRDLDAEGLWLLALGDFGLRLLAPTAAEIAAEPRCSNSRFVWSYRDTRVGVGLRVRILQTVADDGPMALGRLLSMINSDRDPGPAVLALACADLLELDLTNQPIGPRTMVRSRT